MLSVERSLVLKLEFSFYSFSYKYIAVLLFLKIG
jgi:hypothetical protein